jgi:hypothetical protein
MIRLMTCILGDKIKEDEMGSTWGTYRDGGEKYVWV